jgi:hypothetical protein
MLMAAVMMAGVSVARPAEAHMQGMSTASFDVQPDGTVEAQLVFASTEPLRGTPLKDEDLRAFILDGVAVTADGVACPATFRGAGPGPETGGDALVLEADFACPREAAGHSDGTASDITATLYYLSALGPAHREVARISAGSATSEAVLSGDHRAIALRLPGDPLLAKRLRKARLLTVVTAVFAAFLAALFVWRWRATRKA